MQTPEDTIAAFSCSLQPYHLNGYGVFPNDVLTTVFATKFTRGGEASDGVMPLVDCLLEPWPVDLHFTQYSSTPSVRALKSEAERYHLRFQFAAYDADFADHGEPAREDFVNIARVMFAAVEPTPNLCYETKHGCRLIFLIDEINDPDEFEQHYAALLAKLDDQFVRADYGYRIDGATKDWSRLFRSARVMRDNREEYDRMIRLFHTGTLDLRTHKGKKKPVYKSRGQGTKKYDGGDRIFFKLLSGIVKDWRNRGMFDAACYCCRNYTGTELDKILDVVRCKAANEGLDNTEIERTIKSAQQTTKTGR